MQNKSDSLPVCPSEEETIEILKSCASMLGFEYDPDEEKKKRKKEFCERHGITEKDYDIQMKLSKELKAREKQTYDPLRSIDCGSDF